MLRIPFLVVVFFGFGFCATSAVADNLSDGMVYGPWEKFCLSDVNGVPTCFLGSDIRAACFPREGSAAMVISRKGVADVLQLTIPNNGGVPRSVGFTVDRGAMMIARGDPKCSVAGCTANYPLDTALIMKLKQGETLTLTEADTPDRVIARLPLAGFAEAYDGPPHEPKVFEETNAKLQQERRAPPCAVK